MTIFLLTQLAGGVGLILLGMHMMTDGLKLAAGKTLRRVLAKWTDTPFRGLTTGFTITSLVQSSSAVTVAAIGFVNAGFMLLGQAVWVLYGANVGTTTTAWIVALVGLKIDIKALAMPCIAVGMLLWLTGKHTRRAALGEALAGFGLFFLGIEAMESAFAGVSTGLDLQRFVGEGFLGALSFAALGFILTTLMQSSSGAMALILTATAGGMAPLHLAAAAVIGANVGTTSTGLLATIGATPNAKRVAAAHITFNVITGVAAAVILPFILAAILWFRQKLSLGPDPASTLALFHTVFNILGVAILYPLTPRLAVFLQHRFRTEEEDKSAPEFLDSSVLSTPSLALNALQMEMGRLGKMTRRVARLALGCQKRPCREVITGERTVGRLYSTIGQFSSELRRLDMSQEGAEILPYILRVGQYYRVASELAEEINETLARMDELTTDPSLAEAVKEFSDYAAVMLDLADPMRESFTPSSIRTEAAHFEQRYQALKAAILRHAAGGHIPMDQMQEQLEIWSSVRRMVDQVVKGGVMLYESRQAQLLDAPTE